MKRSISLPLFGTLAALLLFPLSPLRAQTAPANAGAPAQNLDFGDFTSATIVGKAWNASDAKDYNAVLAYTGKCIEMYQKQALEQQKSLTEPIPPTDKEHVFSMWALNDVGTAYFIRGQALEKLDRSKEALESYKFLAQNLPFAQCWDTKGWFWKPASAAAERAKALEFETAK